MASNIPASLCARALGARAHWVAQKAKSVGNRPDCACASSSSSEGGFSLIEVMVVMVVISVLTILAVPNLRPLQYTNRVVVAAEFTAGFIDDARRLAAASGRCHQVRLEGEKLVMRARTTPDCVNIGGGDTNWENVREAFTDQQGVSLTFQTSSTGVGDLNNTIIFRPNSRLRGDNDLRVNEDAARVVLQHPEIATAQLVHVTPLGRVCVIAQKKPVPALGATAVCP